MNVPTAGENFVRVIDLFQAKPIAKLGVAILHLLDGSIAMIGKEETTAKSLQASIRARKVFSVLCNPDSDGACAG